MTSQSTVNFFCHRKDRQILEKTGTCNERRLRHRIYRSPLSKSGSNTPLFVISGNIHPMQRSVHCRFCPGAAHPTFGRIERDSQNWTRRRSRSNHSLQSASPRTLPTFVP